MTLLNELQAAKPTAPQDLAAGANPVNVADFQELARQRLPEAVYNYIVGAAGDEISLRRNRSSFDDLLLEPRVLRDVSRLDTSVELFGQRPVSYTHLTLPTNREV